MAYVISLWMFISVSLNISVFQSTKWQVKLNQSAKTLCYHESTFFLRVLITCLCPTDTSDLTACFFCLHLALLQRDNWSFPLKLLNGWISSCETPAIVPCPDWASSNLLYWKKKRQNPHNSKNHNNKSKTKKTTTNQTKSKHGFWAHQLFKSAAVRQ